MSQEERQSWKTDISRFREELDFPCFDLTRELTEEKLALLDEETADCLMRRSENGIRGKED
jgi:hypothetical protein